MIEFRETKAKLYLHVYDEQGNHVGLDYENNELDLEIAGALYFDVLKRTTLVYLPPDIQGCKVVVDASYAEEQVEDYVLTVSSRTNGRLVDSQEISSSIQKGVAEEYSVQLYPERLKVTIYELGEVWWTRNFYGMPLWQWLAIAGLVLFLIIAIAFIRILSR